MDEQVTPLTPLEPWGPNRQVEGKDAFSHYKAAWRLGLVGEPGREVYLSAGGDLARKAFDAIAGSPQTIDGANRVLAGIFREYAEEGRISLPPAFFRRYERYSGLSKEERLSEERRVQFRVAFHVMWEQAAFSYWYLVPTGVVVSPTRKVHVCELLGSPEDRK